MATTTARARTSPKAASESPFKPAELARYFRMKLAAEWGPHDLKRALEERRSQILVLDVRHRQGFREGHIPGAKNIPLEELDSRLKELPRDAEIVTYCWTVTCMLCTKAAAFLSSKGFRARELAGGITEWQAAGFATER